MFFIHVIHIKCRYMLAFSFTVSLSFLQLVRHIVVSPESTLIVFSLQAFTVFLSIFVVFQGHCIELIITE